MSPDLRRAEARDLALLFVLGTAWGGSFLLIKIAVDSVPPLTMAAVRLVLTAAILTVLALAQGHRLPGTARQWGLYLLIGMTGNAIPFVLIAYGEVHIDSARAAILMAVVPLITLCLAHTFVAGERMTALRLLGVFLGLAGVAVLVGPSALGGFGIAVLAEIAVLGAALSYALTNIFASRVRHMPIAVNAAANAIGASVWTLPASLIVDRPWTLDPTTESVLAILGLALVSTSFATMLYFYLLRSAGPSFVSQVNFVVPVMGAFWGWAILSEDLGGAALGALALILLGIALSRKRAQV